MLGEKIYEAQGKVTGTRVLDAATYKIESSYMVQGKFKGIEVTEMGTFWSVMRPGGFLSGEDQAVVMTAEGDVAQARPVGVGRHTGAGKIRYIGTAIYGDNCTGKLAFANNMVVNFDVEVDYTNATMSVQGWEWK